MRNKILIWLVLSVITSIIVIIFINNRNNNTIQKTENPTNNTFENNIANEINESEETMDMVIKITINNDVYNVKLEQNETTKQFLNILPQQLKMNELNGNEKYVYLDTTLPTNSYNPGHIESGDIMLYGSNCLVVFYKSFDTSYSYTKIGHIDNLNNLGNSDITIKFEK